MKIRTVLRTLNYVTANVEVYNLNENMKENKIYAIPNEIKDKPLKTIISYIEKNNEEIRVLRVLSIDVTKKVYECSEDDFKSLCADRGTIIDLGKECDK